MLAHWVLHVACDTVPVLSKTNRSRDAVGTSVGKLGAGVGIVDTVGDGLGAHAEHLEQSHE